MAALCLNLVTVFIIYLLVTFTKMGYMDNILDSNSFFAAFIFLNVEGQLILIPLVCVLNTYLQAYSWFCLYS